MEHPSWNHHFTRCSAVTRVATRHTTFGWDHIGSLSVCTSCWWLRGNWLPPMIKNIRFVATFFQGEKSINTYPLENHERTCQCVHPVWSSRPQSKKPTYGYSRQSPAYFEGDLPPEFLHLSRNMAPRLTSSVFLGWKNTNIFPHSDPSPLLVALQKGMDPIKFGIDHLIWSPTIPFKI